MMHLKKASWMEEQKFTLISCPSQIRKLEVFINDLTHDCEHKQAKHPDILVSLTEAVNNAIIHGNNKDKNKIVKIRCTQNSKKMTFYISDQGKGFNPSQIKDPTAAEHIGECGGRGVYIMKELADSLTYHDNGATVELAFNLPK